MEGLETDFLHFRRNLDGFQRLAVFEAAGPDFFGCLGQDDGPERVAAVEGAAADDSDSFRYFDFFKTFAGAT